MFLDKMRQHSVSVTMTSGRLTTIAKALYLEDNLKGYVSFDEADNATLRS